MVSKETVPMQETKFRSPSAAAVHLIARKMLKLTQPSTQRNGFFIFLYIYIYIYIFQHIRYPKLELYGQIIALMK